MQTTKKTCIEIGKPYFVSYENTTPDEPCSGYYFSVDEKIVGPFSSFERAVQATMEMEYE